ncbi:MAG: leucine-rich repeat protein [Eubacterium sp.]|nr:leucine-rich repeat protein [Eubacterium sp.]
MLIATTLMSINIGTAFAATSGSCGTNATWNYNSSTHTLTISGTGATKDYRDTTNKILRTEQAPWIDYKAEIQNVVVNEGITEIGDYAFFECNALTSVSLPNTLEKLDGWGGAVGNVDKTYGCFQACTALVSITLPNSLVEIEPYVFNGCTALKNIIIPNNVTTIGKYAFFECSALERITFGNSLTTLGENCFRNSGLKKVNWNDALTTIPNYAFLGCGFVEVELPDTVTSVGTQAFKNCTFLRNFTINNASTTLSGNVCEGSNQTVTVYGHSGSTAQSFAETYSYNFVSLDSCSHTNTHTVVSVEPTCTTEGTEQIICDDCGAVVRENSLDALGHTWGEPVDVQDETFVDGHIYKTYVCETCGESKTDAIHQRTADIDLENVDPININPSIDESILNETIFVWIDGYYSKTVIREATCTQTGLETYSCTVDGCVITNETGITTKATEPHVIPKHHTVTNWTVTKAATCTTEGTRTGKCVECGETVTETIKATGHSYDKDNPNEEWDEETDGHTHKLYTCANCGEEIEECSHNEWIEGYYTPMSTTYDNCELPGVELDVCDLCGLRRTVQIPARGEHDYYETSRTAATCTARETIYLACHNCSFTTVQYGDALGHDFVKDAANSVDPTCTTSGSNFYVCSRCSQSKTETVAALGHDPEEGTWVVDTEPTCTKTGEGHGYCLRCEQAYETTIPALGHDYENIETDLTSEGKPGHVLSVPQCTRCNARETGEVVHKEWIEGDYTVTASTPATCTVGANEIRRCTVCNKVGTVETEPALGHMWAYTGTISSTVLAGGASGASVNIPGVNLDDIINSGNGEAVEIPFTGEVTAEGVTFRCLHCGRSTVKPMAEVKALWSFDLLNTAPQRTAPVVHNEGEEDEYTEETNQSSYLDLNGDGIINGKDWAYIKTLTAQENAAKEAAQAEE